MSDEPSVRQQLLAAAVEAASVHGLSRLSMADVAQRAGLSRQTLYRHFASKDALVAEVVVTETALLIEQVAGAAAAHDDPRASLEAALHAALVVTREHPLLDRLVRTEPETLLPLLTTDGGPVMAQVRAVVEAILAERAIVPAGVGAPEPDPVELRRFADVVTRLLVSYAVSAPDDPPEVVAAFVARFLIDGVADRLAATPLDPTAPTAPAGAPVPTGGHP